MLGLVPAPGAGADADAGGVVSGCAVGAGGVVGRGIGFSGGGRSQRPTAWIGVSRSAFTLRKWSHWRTGQSGLLPWTKTMPSQASIRGKFKFQLDFAPVPDGGDFRISIQREERGY